MPRQPQDAEARAIAIFGMRPVGEDPALSLFGAVTGESGDADCRAAGRVGLRLGFEGELDRWSALLVTNDRMAATGSRLPSVAQDCRWHYQRRVGSRRSGFMGDRWCLRSTASDQLISVFLSCRVTANGVNE